MILNKYKKQNIEVVKNNQPDLAASLKAHFPELSDEDKGRIAGFVIEYVIQAGGDTDIFMDKTEEPSDWESID